MDTVWVIYLFIGAKLLWRIGEMQPTDRLILLGGYALTGVVIELISRATRPATPEELVDEYLKRH